MGITYAIEFAPAAKRQFARLPRDIQRRIVRKIENLADNPRPVGAVKLRNRQGRYRIRVGRSYRVIYQIEDDFRRVIVLTVKHRKDAYR